MANEFDDFIAGLLHQAGLQQGVQAAQTHAQLVQTGGNPVLPDPRDQAALAADKAALRTMGNAGGAAFGNGLDRGRQAVRHPMDLNIGPAQVAPTDARKGGSTSHDHVAAVPKRSTHYGQTASVMEDAGAQARHDHFWQGAPVGDTMWFAGQHPDLFPPGGVSEAQGYAQYDRQRPDNSIPGVVTPSTVDGMPLMEKPYNGIRQGRENDIAYLRERGQDIPSWMYQGLYPEEVANGLRSGAEMDGYRREYGMEPGRTSNTVDRQRAERDFANIPTDPKTGKPVIPVRPEASDDAGNVTDQGTDGVYRGDKRPGDPIRVDYEPESLREQLRNRSAVDAMEILEQRMQRLRHALHGEGITYL